MWTERQRLLNYCNVIVQNSMICLICECILIISLYSGKVLRFSSLYRGSDLSIHFTVTFAATQNIHRYTGNIVTSRIVNYIGVLPQSLFHCEALLGYNNILTSNTALKQQHKSDEMATNNTKMISLIHLMFSPVRKVTQDDYQFS